MAMSKFSLSYPIKQAFPREIIISGSAYFIDARHKTILLILRQFSEGVKMPSHALQDALKWFYMGNAPDDYESAVEGLKTFIRGGVSDTDSEDQQKTYDFEFDAAEIYVSFLTDYNIDLSVTNLHWYKFLLLLAHLSPDTAFKRKIQWRFKDLTGLKGTELSDATAYKQSIQLPKNYTTTDLQLISKFDA
jgi:hypothetical protein